MKHLRAGPELLRDLQLRPQPIPSGFSLAIQAKRVLATSSPLSLASAQSVLADPAEQLSDEQFLPLAPFKREEVPSTRLAGEDAGEEENGRTGTFANELLIRFLFAVGKRFTLPVEEIALHLAGLGIDLEE